MATTLPVPILFKLPDGWEAVDPDAANAPSAAFVAVQPAPEEDFVANIVIEGERRPEDLTLEALADESVERLRNQSGTTTVLKRGEPESGPVHGYAQKLSISAVVNGQPQDLAQSQVYLPLDIDVPGERAVILMSLTSSARQHPAVLTDFLTFLGTVRPDVEADAAQHGD